MSVDTQNTVVLPKVRAETPAQQTVAYRPRLDPGRPRGRGRHRRGAATIGHVANLKAWGILAAAIGLLAWTVWALHA